MYFFQYLLVRCKLILKTKKMSCYKILIHKDFITNSCVNDPCDAFSVKLLLTMFNLLVQGSGWLLTSSISECNSQICGSPCQVQVLYIQSTKPYIIANIQIYEDFFSFLHQLLKLLQFTLTNIKKIYSIISLIMCFLLFLKSEI